LAVWLQFDSRPLKSQESTRFPCVQAMCNIPLESSRQGLQLCFRPHRDRRFAQEGMCPQSPRSPSCCNFGTRESWGKKPFGCDPVKRCRVYYKGEGGGFPQVWAVVSLVCPCCPWFVLTPKVFQLCTNHLVWVVCKPVWVSEACQLFLVPSRSSNTPLYPSKCCELENVARFLPLPLFSTWTHVWVLWGVGSASALVKIVPMVCRTPPARKEIEAILDF
jgi:hypothetical protein